MAYNRNKPSRPGQQKRRFFHKRKVCRFCSNSEIIIEYKEPGTLRRFLTERGKIIPRRISGNCAKHQRELTSAIRKARTIALLPFVTTEG